MSSHPGDTAKAAVKQANDLGGRYFPPREKIACRNEKGAVARPFPYVGLTTALT